MTTATPPRFALKRSKPTGPSSPVTLLGAPGLPQVDLLPPSVRAGRALQRTKLVLVLVVALVLLLALLGYVASLLSARSAQSALDDAQATTARLTQKQAEYAEVPRVKAAIAAVQQATTIGMGSEILWADYVTEVLTKMPPGSQVMSFATTTMNPLEAPILPADPLATPGIGMITLTHRSPTVPDTSAWLDTLNSITGFSDAQLLSETISEEEGTVYYDVTTTVQVNADALSRRYLEEDK